MKEQIVSFEVSKLLKQLGFNIEVPAAYIGKELILNKVDLSNQDFSGHDCFVELEEFDENWNMNNALFCKNGTYCFGCKLDNKIYFEAYSAPTQALAQKWLRYTHNIYVESTFQANSDDDELIYNFDSWYYTVHYGTGAQDYFPIPIKETYSLYEEALEAGIHAALEYLKPKL